MINVIKEYTIEKDLYEVQEFNRINFIGGYGSVFGDGTEVICDICQCCLRDMIQDICTFKNI